MSCTLNILNLVAYIANIGLVMGVPSLFNLPDNGELSAKYQTLVTPAGWAFAIWGIIFTFQAVWAVVQVLVPSFRSNPLVQGIGYNYIFVCAVQVAWTFSFALERMVLALIWMLLILYFLFRIYQEQTKVLLEHNDDDSFSKNFWLLRFPFNLHLGWIVAATLVNFNVLLVFYQTTATVQFGFAIVTLLIALTVGGGVLLLQKAASRPTVTIPLVLVWALNAISNELKDPNDLILDTFSSDQIGKIQSGAFVSAMILLVSTVAIVVHALWKSYSRTGSEETRLLE